MLCRRVRKLIDYNAFSMTYLSNYCSRRLGNMFQPPGTYVPAGWEIGSRRLEQ